MHLDEVCRQTDAHRWGGRVAIGHVTKLSAVTRSRPARTIGRRLADAGVAVTVLPATDLFLMGREHEHHVPRGVAPAHRLLDHGVTCSLATNNVLNPFTPFGDCSLMRMANLYANIAQVGRQAELRGVLRHGDDAAGAADECSPDYGIAVGHPADIVVLDSRDPAMAVAELAQPLFGIKRGRRSFTRAAAMILHRSGEAWAPVSAVACPKIQRQPYSWAAAVAASTARAFAGRRAACDAGNHNSIAKPTG